MATITIPPKPLTGWAPMPAMPARIAALRTAWWFRYAVYFGIFLLWMFFVFAATFESSFRSWFHGWEQYDAVWYRRIWTEHYHDANHQSLAFPPGYSLIVGCLARLFSASFLSTAMALNLVAFFAVTVLIANWLAERFEVSPYLVFVFTLSAPASYFAFTSYSDILFMLLLWVVLWVTLAEKPLPRYARITAQIVILFTLPWIRLTAYALASWLLFRKAAAATVLLSFALWIALNRAITGDPFYFVHAQKYFKMPAGGFFKGFAYSFRWFFNMLPLVIKHFREINPGSWLAFAALPIAYFVVLALTAGWLIFRGERLLGVTAASILVLSYNQAFWRSVVRYDLPLIPLLCLPLLIGFRSQSYLLQRGCRAVFCALLVAQFGLQFHFASAFHCGTWGF